MVRSGVSQDGLQVGFWGVRGSTCAAGHRFAEFGGNTPCVEIHCGERLFLIDAGTGIAAFGEANGEVLPDRVDVLLSHLHLDHVSGLPFFKPAVLARERTIHTHCGNLGGDSAEAALNRLFSPPIFPICLEQLPASFQHHGFRAGETLQFGDVRVRTILLNHPGGATGYRFDHGGRSVCYISDLEHSDPWPDPGLVAFVTGADLVIYDGMFTESEYSYCRGWGHSTWQKGVDLCRAANAHALAIFHLYPGHDDDYLRILEAQLKSIMPTAFVARERQTIAFDPYPAVAEMEKPAKVPAT
jgi:phosphoribosyl 1,2-cyclic phosphodiesterase